MKQIEEKGIVMGFQIMFDQANSFFICARLCEKELEKEPARHDLYSTPQIVNESFACEVYIKTLLDYKKINFGRKHKLNELFELLPSDIIRNISQRILEKYPTQQDAFGFKLIDKIADAFVKWRYSYEETTLSCEVGYLDALTVSLRDECCSQLYGINWESYCKIAKINSDL